MRQSTYEYPSPASDRGNHHPYSPVFVRYFSDVLLIAIFGQGVYLV